jgi:VanZ family protein
MVKKVFSAWFPAVLMMAVIFCFSSIPASKLPNFGQPDLLVKKGGHLLAYALLALAYWAGMRFDNRRLGLALLLALIFAATDEFHQSFVVGRHPSWVDALVIDGSGAASALALAYWRRKKRTTK